MEQRSDLWFKQRLGRFTGSVVSKLMGKAGLGETGKTLAFEKACEIVFGRDPEWDVETWDMKRGNEQEPQAFELASRIFAAKFMPVEEATFFPLGDNSGSSPDGLIGKNAILEIKAPRPEKFFRIVKDGISAIQQDWIDQMQHEMRCTNSEKAHFFIYLQWRGKELYHTLEIPFNKQRSDLILERIEEAVTIRDQYVEELKANVQFDLNFEE